MYKLAIIIHGQLFNAVLMKGCGFKFHGYALCPLLIGVGRNLFIAFISDYIYRHFDAPRDLPKKLSLYHSVTIKQFPDADVYWTEVLRLWYYSIWGRSDSKPGLNSGGKLINDLIFPGKIEGVDFYRHFQMSARGR
jgi:hypothetical protein